MAQIGAHAYISVLLKTKISYWKWFFPSFLIGSILPDIDYFFAKLHELVFIPSPLYLLNKTFTHSIFTTIFIYLLLLILYEIKKNKNIINIANGLIVGISLHILIDIFFWIEKIDLFWPLPMNPVHLWKINLPEYIYKIIMTLEFVFFRGFAHYAIQVILNYPGKNSYLIKLQTIWMKAELYFIIIFIVCSYYLSLYHLLAIFFLGYIPSIIMMFYTIVNIWDSLDYYPPNIKNEIELDIKERDNLININ